MKNAHVEVKKNIKNVMVASMIGQAP